MLICLYLTIILVCLLFSLSVTKLFAHDLKTEQGNPIRHEHYSQGMTPEEKQIWKDITEQLFPNSEQIGHPTREYNCHGLTFDQRRSWIDTAEAPLSVTREIEKILHENGYQSQGKRGKEKAKVDDIIVYHTQTETEIIHTGIVIEVDENGKVRKVQSKWGDKSEYKHHPDMSPYGNEWEIYRVACKEDE